jgi:hypothetical protein
MPCAMRGCQAATSAIGGRAAGARGLVADDASGVVDLRPRHDGGDGRRRRDGRRGGGRELGVAHQEHAADGLDALVDRGLHGRVVDDVEPLRIDRDRPHEKEQAHGDAGENADDEHEGVEELLIVLAQRRAPKPLNPAAIIADGRAESRRPTAAQR